MSVNLNNNQEFVHLPVEARIAIKIINDNLESDSLGDLAYQNKHLIYTYLRKKYQEPLTSEFLIHNVVGYDPHKPLKYLTFPEDRQAFLNFVRLVYKEPPSPFYKSIPAAKIFKMIKKQDAQPLNQ